MLICVIFKRVMALDLSECREEPQDIYINKLSLPRKDDCKTRKDMKCNAYQNKDQHRTPTNNGRYIKQLEMCPWDINAPLLPNLYK